MAFLMMNAESWNVFHDGEIVSVAGDVPGDLEFSIEAEYLRRQFGDEGKGFKIRVIACDMISFKSFKTNQTLLGLGALRGQDLEILSAKRDGDTLVLTTSAGDVRLRYDSEALALDTGRPLQISDVAAAGDRALSDLRKPKT